MNICALNQNRIDLFFAKILYIMFPCETCSSQSVQRNNARQCLDHHSGLQHHCNSINSTPITAARSTRAIYSAVVKQLTSLVWYSLLTFLWISDQEQITLDHICLRRRPDHNTTVQTLQLKRTQGIDSLTWVISQAKYNATCIGSKFDHQIAPLALVTNLTTRWRHLHWLQIWPPDGTTCISSKFVHQMAPLETITFSV